MLSHHHWIIYDGTRTHQALPHSKFSLVETLKQFYLYVEGFWFLWKSFMLGKQRNWAFCFSIFQRTIYRNLFLLPFTFIPRSYNGKHTTQTSFSVVSSWRKQPPFLFSSSAKTFRFPPTYTWLYNYPIKPPTLIIFLFYLCWFGGKPFSLSRFLSLLLVTFEQIFTTSISLFHLTS